MALRGSAPPLHCYLIGGLSVSSGVSLPAFEAACAHPDVVVHAAPLPPDRRGWAHEARRFKASPGCWFFAAPDGSRFLVQDGHDVAYDMPEDVSPATLAGHLLQPVFATVLHQRELLALHASAVEGPDGAIAFMGPPAAGKSTLAAWMHARGHAFIADDVCPVDVRGRPVVPGGFAYQKLTPAALREAVTVGEAAPIESDGRGRVRVMVRARPAAAQPLACAYILRVGAKGQGSPDGVASIETLTGPSAVAALVKNTYRRQYLRGLGRLPAHLRACARVAERVPIHQVSFAHETCDVHALGRVILDHLHR